MSKVSVMGTFSCHDGKAEEMEAVLEQMAEAAGGEPGAASAAPSCDKPRLQGERRGFVEPAPVAGRLTQRGRSGPRPERVPAPPGRT